MLPENLVTQYPFLPHFHQFDFHVTFASFLEIQSSGHGGVGTTSQNASNRSEILHMSALLGRLTNQPPDQVLSLLNEAVEAHFKCVRGMIFGYDYLTVLNPDFVGDLVKEYLLYAPNDPVQQGQAVPPALKQVLLILETVTRACPGLRDALFLVSKARYLSGDVKAALNTLQHIGKSRFLLFITSKVSKMIIRQIQYFGVRAQS